MAKLESEIPKLEGDLALAGDQINISPKTFTLIEPLESDPPTRPFKMDLDTTMHPKEELHLTLITFKVGVELKKLHKLIEKTDEVDIDLAERIDQSLSKLTEDKIDISPSTDLYHLSRTNENGTEQTVIQPLNDSGLTSDVRHAILQTAEDVVSEIQGPARERANAILERLREEIESEEPFPHVTLYTDVEGAAGIAVHSKSQFETALNSEDQALKITSLTSVDHTSHDLESVAHQGMRTDANTYQARQPEGDEATLTTLHFGKNVLLIDAESILQKHAGGAVGSLFEGSTAERVEGFFDVHVNEEILSECNPRKVVANLEVGTILGNDSLAEVESLSRSGVNIEVGSDLEPGISYDATCRDTNGEPISGKLELTEVREGIYQPVLTVDSDHELPSTTKLNLILLAIDVDDKQAAWVDKERLDEHLKAAGTSLEESERVCILMTSFPGTYAPAANGPQSEVEDPALTPPETGVAFWKRHALISHQE